MTKSEVTRLGYTESPPNRQDDLDLSVDTEGNSLRIAFGVPWDAIDWLVSFGPAFFEVLSSALSERTVSQATREDNHRQAKAIFAERARDLRRIGRIASRRVRVACAAGCSNDLAIKNAADALEQSPAVVHLAIKLHRRVAGPRLQRLRDRQLIRLADQGLSNAEIGRRIGKAPSYAGKLVRAAIDRQRSGGAANDR